MLELFSAKRLQSFQHIREEEVNVLMTSIVARSSETSTPIDVSTTSYSLTANITCRIAFGKIFRGEEMGNEDFKHIMRRSMVALGSFSATDLFPGVGWIIDRISGVHWLIEKSFVELDTFFQRVVEYRSKFKPSSRSEENIVDVLLRMVRESSEADAIIFSPDCVKALMMVIIETN